MAEPTATTTTLPKEPRTPVVPEAGERETSTRAALRNPRRLRTEVLAGLVVALALIPEAISFSIIAGVDPRVGLFSSFVMAITIAFVGGRPAMITAATGAIALVIAPVAREYGLEVDPLTHLADTVPLGAEHWLFMLPFFFASPIAMELVKLYFRRRTAVAPA